MSDYIAPVLYTLFIWWFSTGVILYLDGLPRHTFRRSWLGATVVLLAALAGLAMTRANTSVGAVYCAFSCAVLVWGWQEISFLMGYVTGPRQTPCPKNCSEWTRFGHALQAILYHEIALVVLAVAVFGVTWGGENQVGPWTFMVLWIMRQSAKLNLFLGVRNLSEEFLPEHLRYLESYFRKRPMNLLLPISVTAATMLAALIWREALAAHAKPFEIAGFTLVAMMLTLAILEHWFLVLPLPATALWRWSLKSHEATRQAPLTQHSHSAKSTGRVVKPIDMIKPADLAAATKEPLQAPLP